MLLGLIEAGQAGFLQGLLNLLSNVVVYIYLEEKEIENTLYIMFNVEAYYSYDHLLVQCSFVQ